MARRRVRSPKEEQAAAQPEKASPETVTAPFLGYQITAPSDVNPAILASFLREVKIAHERHRQVGGVTIHFPPWNPGLLRDR